MVNSILSILGGVLTIAAKWCEAKTRPANVEADQIKKERQKQDELNEALAKGDIDTIRRILSR